MKLNSKIIQTNASNPLHKPKVDDMHNNGFIDVLTFKSSNNTKKNIFQSLEHFHANTHAQSQRQKKLQFVTLFQKSLEWILE